jgi:anti-sigma B factor antagonist
MPTDCTCRCEHITGSRALVTAVGELDLNSCPQFKTALDAAARRVADHLVVDLSGVTFMDSTALSLLTAEQRRRADPLHLVVTEPQLLRILEVTGCTRIFVIHSSLDDALLETGRLQAQRARPV